MSNKYLKERNQLQERYMNDNSFENRYDQIKEDLKAKWRVLTDKDLENIKGQKDKLVSFIEKCYGQSKEKIEEQIDTFLNKDKTSHAQD